jgi:protein-tyrosine-phosphatase
MMQNKFDLMFICTGNTCRSPMAKAIAQSLAPELKIDSAGLYAAEGECASENAIKALGEIGIDLSTHRSKQLKQDCADYYVPMTESHAQLLKSAGIDEKRILRFSSEVPDPFGGDLDVYRAARDKLEVLIKDLLEKWKQEN